METIGARAAILREYDLLGSAPEDSFNDLVELAQRLFDVETALINVISDEKAFFKGRVGFPLTEVPIEDSVCAIVYDAKKTVVIKDMREDVRTASMPYIATPPYYKFYAAAPLKSSDGFVIGTFCVVGRDARPRGLSPIEQRNLEILARQASVTIESRRLLRRKDILKQELLHRGKNLFTMIQAVVTQTMSHSKTLSDARSALRTRLDALGGANDILVRDDHHRADMLSLVETTKRAYDVADRIQTNGPKVVLDGKKAVSVCMILNELATNSLKYGALSDDGMVEVSWSLGEQFVMDWVEKGGPPVREPTHQGFGTKLLKMGLPMMGSEGILTYDPAGLRYRVGASV